MSWKIINEFINRANKQNVMKHMVLRDGYRIKC